MNRDEIMEKLRSLHERATAEKRDLTAEERTQWDSLKAQLAAIQEQEARAAWLESLASSQPAAKPDPRIGMSPSETRRYSILRAINAAASHDWRGAELEHEASEAVAKRMGKDPNGFYVPYDWLESERRDLVVGTPTAGGNLVATNLLAQSFIDMLRNRMAVRAAGATVMAGLQGNMAIPRQTGGATAYWVAESGSPTDSQPAFDQVTLTPKTVGAYTDISRKLLLQSSIDVEAFVRLDLATTLALEIDRAALHGSGTSNQPAGIASTAGIGSVVGGDNGAAPTWENIVALETEVAVNNADVGTLAYMTNAKVRGKLKATLKTATYGDIPVWESGDTPLNGYRALVTNQVRSDLTKGTSAGVCSAIFFGNWADLVIGMWGALDILVDPYTGSTSGTVRVVALQDVDIVVRHAESFAAMLDALTA